MTVSGPEIVSNPGNTAVQRAADRLRGGELVAFPTETVYGLGADATCDRAVAGIFEAKQRPTFNPLICHFPDVDAAAEEVELVEHARRLGDAFWPGSLTLVLPRRRTGKVSRLASAGLETLAVRVPDHPLALALISAAGRPVAAPSANRSGQLSPTRAEHVAKSLYDVDVLILDGGPCRVGVESTVVAIGPNGDVSLLREGGIASEEIEDAIGRPLIASNGNGEQPASPGMLAHHYGTAIPLRMNADRAASDEAWICFGPVPQEHTGPARSLSETRDLREAAANLFELLHWAENTGADRIAVATVPDRGVGRAINDRLRRSAAASTVS